MVNGENWDNMDVIVYEHLPDPAVDGFDAAVWLWSVQGQRLDLRRLHRGKIQNRPAYPRARPYVQQLGRTGARLLIDFLVERFRDEPWKITLPAVPPVSPSSRPKQ